MQEQYDQEQYDVVIAGYGPVGQVLAALLGRAGHRVAAIERFPAFYPMPRAVHFDHEVARIFQNIGLRPDQSTAIEPYDAMYAWRNADRENLQLVDWSGVGPTGWHTSNFFVQPLLEPQLDQLVRAQPTVSVQRGWEVVAVEDEPDEPLTVVVEQTDGFTRTGHRRALTARYVIGADGANSFVRTEMGSHLHDLGFFFDWLIVDLILHEPRTFDPPAWQLCDPARPTTIVPACRAGAGGSSCGCPTSRSTTSTAPNGPGNCSNPGTCTRPTPPSSGTPSTPSRPAGPTPGGAAG